MSQLDLIPSVTGDSERDKYLAQVIENSGGWAKLAVTMVGSHNPEKEYTGEDFRTSVEEHIGKPHHSNAWGSVINTALRKGLIEATGEYRKMKAISSHARKTPVYRVVQLDYDMPCPILEE